MSDEQIVGIYAADGGWRGELRYVLGVIAGGEHCSLCDITHGWYPLGRPAWKKACATAPFELLLIHRDRADPAQLEAAATLPAIIAGKEGSWRLLVDSGELDDCGTDPEQLIALIGSRRGT